MTDKDTLNNKMSSKSDLQFTQSDSSNFDFGDSGSNLDFTSSGSSNFNFGDSSSNLQFTSPDLSKPDNTKNIIADSIDIHRIVNPKKAGHYNIIVKGLNNLEKDKLKGLMSTIKRKLGIGGGAFIKSEDIDPDNDVILFSGDFAEKIKTIIVKELQVNETKISIYE